MIVDAIKDCRQVLQMDANNLIASEYLTRRNISLTLPYSSSSSSKFPGNGLSATIDKIRLSMKDHPLVELWRAISWWTIRTWTAIDSNAPHNPLTTHRLMEAVA